MIDCHRIFFRTVKVYYTIKSFIDRNYSHYYCVKLHHQSSFLFSFLIFKNFKIKMSWKQSSCYLLDKNDSNATNNGNLIINDFETSFYVALYKDYQASTGGIIREIDLFLFLFRMSIHNISQFYLHL